MMPKRKIGPQKGINRRCLVSRKSSDEEMVFGESLLERDFVRLCNFTAIGKVEYQPLSIQYNYKKRSRKYTPDFLVTNDQGARTLVEVKPSNQVNDPDNVIKFEVAKIFCQEQGWTFKVVTELDLHQGQLRNNINILMDVMRVDLTTHDVMMVYELLREAGPCSIEELQILVPEISGSIFTAIVYQLLLDGFFIADLISEKISQQTMLSINKGKMW